jgi:hypothetical protein
VRRLFDRYNRLYFRGKIKNYRVAIAPLTGYMGLCDYSKRTITIDPEQQATASFAAQFCTKWHTPPVPVTGGTVYSFLPKWRSYYDKVRQSP